MAIGMTWGSQGMKCQTGMPSSSPADSEVSATHLAAGSGWAPSSSDFEQLNQWWPGCDTVNRLAWVGGVRANLYPDVSRETQLAGGP